ncbi:MAG TPA: hypothetical protein VK939_16370 [Longimicrobiales bacterium]|nr:hypothetical protein [Longimicrobiales bacterium]
MRRRLLPGTCALMLLLPAPAAAQLGLVESLFRNVTDISFYGSRVGMMPRSETLRAGEHGVYGFGVELLFEVGSVSRALPREPGDTATLRLVDVQVQRSGGRADTTYNYQPVAARARTEQLWSFELGVGYGQLTGFELRDSDAEIRGAVRELPAISFYASHEATGAYAGIRTGLLQTHALQVIEADGTVTSGNGQSFQLGAALGYAADVGGIFPFVELGWMLRHFPGIDWKTTALPPEVPRELRLSGWQLQAGIQVGLK